MTEIAVRPLGLMHQMWALRGISDLEALRTAMEEIELADQLGFDSVWIGEHHRSPGAEPFYGRIPAAELFLAHVAARTPRIQVGTGVKVLSTTSPRRAAEEMSLLHLLTNRRAEFGLGMGVTLPTSKETRAEKASGYRAALAEILALLDGVATPPLSPSPDPALRSRIWVAARDPGTLEFAAAQELNLVVGQAEIAERQAILVRRYRAIPGHAAVRGVRLAFVAETTQAASDRSEAAVRTYFGMMNGKGYHKEAIEAGQLPGEARDLAEMRRQMSFAVGTPAQVAAALNVYIALTGVDRLDVMAQVPGLATEDVRRSLALLHQEVRPLLRFPRRVPALAAWVVTAGARSTAPARRCRRPRRSFLIGSRAGGKIRGARGTANGVGPTGARGAGLRCPGPPSSRE